jgi:hypothetical protein
MPLVLIVIERAAALWSDNQVVLNIHAPVVLINQETWMDVQNHILLELIFRAG